MDQETSPLTYRNGNNTHNLPRILAIVSIVASGLAIIFAGITFATDIFVTFVVYILIMVSIGLAILALRREEENKYRILAIISIILCGVAVVISLIAIINYAILRRRFPPGCGDICRVDSDCDSNICNRCIRESNGKFCYSS